MLRAQLPGLAIAAVFALGAGVLSENDHPGTLKTAQAETAPVIAPASKPALHEMPAGVMDVGEVEAPQTTLTNLTVYSRGRDIGHIQNVLLGDSGRAELVEI